jgi:hypothetical protein
VLSRAKAGHVFSVPGEHDVIGDDGKTYLERYGKGAIGKGWQSFDYQGVHCIGLVNEAKHSAVAGKHSLFHRHSATFNPDGTLKCKAFLAA